MKANRLYGAYAAAFLATAFAQITVADKSPADPRGLWRAQDGAIVRVASCGGAMCGTMVSQAPGKSNTDVDNPDPDKRQRSVVGVEVIISMTPNGPNKWSGRLYNLAGGQTVDGSIVEVDDRTIRVEGCAGPLCGSQIMTRIR